MWEIEDNNLIFRGYFVTPAITWCYGDNPYKELIVVGHAGGVSATAGTTQASGAI